MAGPLVNFIYFIYDSNVNTDCGLGCIANISGTQCITRYSVHHVFPDALIDDESDMMSDLNILRILTAMKLMNGGQKNMVNDVALLPTYENIDDYVTRVHTAVESIDTITNLVADKPFLILFLKVFNTTYTDQPPTTHYVPIVRFGERWIIMGGERRSSMKAIEHQNLPAALTTQAGREAILEHCKAPFGDNLTVDFLGTNLINVIVPNHPGPKKRNNDMEGFPKSDVVKQLPWTEVKVIGERMTNFQKEYAIFVKTDQYDIPILEFE